MKRLLLIVSVALCVLRLTPAYGQAVKTITGTVYDKGANQVLPGVSIALKGSSTETATDNNGQFSIKVTGNNPILIVRFIGFNTREIPVENKTTIRVDLESSSNELGEVSVTALGIEKKNSKLGYSVTTVKGEEIANTNTINPITALQGKVAGVNVNVVGGSGVQSSPSILIRGSTSLTGSSQPIFVVDGIILNNNDVNADSGTDYGSQLKNLNPDNYESITVLKGAAATSVYGSRGINGAIVITTKRGKFNSGLGVELNSTYQLADVYANSIPLQNEYGMGNIFREGAFRSDNTNTITSFSFGPKFDGREITSIYNPNIKERYVAQPDNWRAFFQTGNYINNNVAISGGSEKVSYRLSYTNTSNKGSLVNNGMKRDAFDFRSTGQLNNVFSVDMGINYARTQTTNGYSQNRYSWPSGSNVGFMTYYAVPRNANLEAWRKDYRNADGSVRTYGYDLWNSQVNNLFSRFDNLSEERSENSLLANLQLKAQVTPWFDLSARGNYNFYKIFTESRERGNGAGGVGGSFGLGGSYNSNYNMLFMAHATQKAIKDDLSIDYRVIGELYGNSLSESYYSNTNGGLIIPNQFVLGNSVNVPVVNSNIGYSFGRPSSRVYGLAGLVNFSYKEFLNLELTARNDWVSSLTYPAGYQGANNYTVFYPSANMSYSFYDHFNKSMPSWLSSGRLRASLAYVGRGTDPYATSFQGYLPNVVVDMNGNSVSTSSQQNANILPNPNLRPELQRSIELGTNIGFFNDRLVFDAAYYRSNTKNQILTIPGVSETGYSSMRINAGDIQNQGVELLITGSPVKKKDFGWDLSANFTHNRGKIKRFYPGITEYQKFANYNGAGVYAYEGGDYGVLTAENNWSTAYAFTDANTGYPLLRIAAREQSTDPDTRYSVPAYEYVYNQGTEPRYRLGRTEASFLAAFNTTFRYKSWSLYTQIDSRVGGKIYSESYNYGMGRGNVLESLKYRDQASGGVARTDSYTGQTVYDGVIPNAVFDAGQMSPLQPDVSIAGMTFQQAYERGLVEPWKSTNYYQNTYGWGTNLNFNGSVTDNTWVMLREISLGYQFPQKWVNSIKLQSVGLRFMARNIGYIYNGLQGKQNPESIQGNDPFSPFITGGVPFTRFYSLALNVKF